MVNQLVIHCKMKESGPKPHIPVILKVESFTFKDPLPLTYSKKHIPKVLQEFENKQNPTNVD